MSKIIISGFIPRTRFSFLLFLIDSSSTETARILRILRYCCVFLLASVIQRKVWSASEAGWCKPVIFELVFNDLRQCDLFSYTFNNERFRYYLNALHVFILYYHHSTRLKPHHQIGGDGKIVFLSFHVGLKMINAKFLNNINNELDSVNTLLRISFRR